MQNAPKRFNKLPFEVIDLDESYSSSLGPGGKWVKVGPKSYIQQDSYKEYGLDIYNFEVRPDDVFLVGYPRSGTTLHCEMVWQIGNDLDYNGAQKDVIDYRFPHIDFCLFDNLSKRTDITEAKFTDKNILDTVKKLQKISPKELAERKGRRFIKAHLPLSLLPPQIFEVGAKVIYCARNPKDMMVSMYNVTKFFKRVAKVEFKTLFDSYKRDLSWNCPYFEHVKEAWALRNEENFLFLFYEDTIKDKRQTITKIANFLGKELSNDQVDSLEDYLSIEKFRNNKSVNCDHLVQLGMANDNGQFIKKGKPGGWREYFVGDMEKEFNNWMEKNLKGTDLKFPET